MTATRRAILIMNALCDLAAAYGTAMPRYLLAPEVAVLLPFMHDLRQRLFADTLWNTGGRLNEVLPLTPGDFGVRLENGKYPTLSLFFKQAYVVALMPIQSGPCDRRLIHFMK